MNFRDKLALDLGVERRYVMFEGWLKSIGVDIKKVPYRNPVEAGNDLAAGRVQVYESAYAIARPHIEAGKIKVLAVTNTARASVIPDIPTVAEAGYPALTIDGLVGLFGPPSMTSSAILLIRNTRASSVLRANGSALVMLRGSITRSERGRAWQNSTWPEARSAAPSASPE